MTNELYEAIRRYHENPSGHNRERGMTEIVNGGLEPIEVERIRWAIREYDERVRMTS